MGYADKAGNVKVAIFSGGAGSRLWPVSRRDRPKQFQPLTGGPHSLFQHMLGLLEKQFGLENIFVFTGSDHVDAIRDQMPGLPHENIVAEPEMRDTLAAVGYAAAVIEHRFPGTALATLWGGDHIIRHEETFLRALGAACTLSAEHRRPVMLDVRPTFASTQLGYVEIGEKKASLDGFTAYEFLRFTEKPDKEHAQEYVTGGRHLWNTGYFVWSSAVILDLYRRHAPETHAALMRITAAMDTPEEESVTRDEYLSIPKTSVDYAVFSRIAPGEMFAIPADLGWADVGTWDVLRDELATAKGENVILAAEHMGIDTSNTVVFQDQASPRLIVTLGVDDLIVVDTADALLIAPASRAQDVKKIVERLAAEGKTDYL